MVDSRLKILDSTVNYEATPTTRSGASTQRTANVDEAKSLGPPQRDPPAATNRQRGTEPPGSLDSLYSQANKGSIRGLSETI